MHFVRSGKGRPEAAVARLGIWVERPQKVRNGRFCDMTRTITILTAAVLAVSAPAIGQFQQAGLSAQTGVQTGQMSARASANPNGSAKQSGQEESLAAGTALNAQLD